MSAPALNRPADIATTGGILLGVIAYTLFAFHDAFIKGLIYDLPVAQIVLVRSLGIVVGAMLVGGTRLLRDSITSSRKGLMLGRAVITLVAWLFYYSAGRYLQLAEMTTLYYLAPIATMILAVMFLGERFTLSRTAAALIGFAGVVIATNPLGLQIGLPALAVIVAALCWAVAMILMRTISRSESSLVQIFLMNLVFVVGVLGFALADWHPMDGRQFALALGSAVIGGLAQYLLVESARRVPAGVLGTIEYTALIWAFVLGYIFWQEMPPPTIYLGAAFIMAAGLALAWGERRKGG